MIGFQNKIQLLEFHLKETSKEDIFIHANGITNRLTGKEDIYPNQNFDFHYVLSSTEPIKKIDLSFSAGKGEERSMVFYFYSMVSFCDRKTHKSSIYSFNRLFYTIYIGGKSFIIGNGNV